MDIFKNDYKISKSDYVSQKLEAGLESRKVLSTSLSEWKDLANTYIKNYESGNCDFDSINQGQDLIAQGITLLSTYNKKEGNDVNRYYVNPVFPGLCSYNVDLEHNLKINLAGVKELLTKLNKYE